MHSAYLQEFHLNLFYSQFETHYFCNTIVTQGNWIRIELQLEEGTQKIFCTRCDYRVWEIQFLKPAYLRFGWAYRNGEGWCLLEVELTLKQQDTHCKYVTPLSQTPILSLSLERTDPLQREARIPWSSWEVVFTRIHIGLIPLRVAQSRFIGLIPLGEAQ